MTTQKLKALVNTVIKQSTIDSTEITDLKQKFSWEHLTFAISNCT
jgi:hypothetical protein